MLVFVYFILTVAVQSVKKSEKHPRILFSDCVGQKMMMPQEQWINVPQHPTAARRYSFFDESAST
jgi:hypothetical protein